LKVLKEQALKTHSNILKHITKIILNKYM